MIEYDSERNTYIIHFSDDTDVKGWARELNGLVFVGLNYAYTLEWPEVLDNLLAKDKKQIRKEVPVMMLEEKDAR